MENEWTFEELKKIAIEAMEKRYEDSFIKSHEMLMRDMERRRQERTNKHV